MMQLLYSFGIGLAFTVGIFTGAFLCTAATRKGRESLANDMREHNERVENRLIGYVNNTARIAAALETLTDAKR